jgi:hypothetical protein
MQKNADPARQIKAGVDPTQKLLPNPNKLKSYDKTEEQKLEGGTIGNTFLKKSVT